MNRNPFFTFDPSGLPLQAGKILVSVPLSNDFYFDRTVILLIKNTNKENLGIVLNRSLPLTLHDIFPQESSRQYGQIPVFRGGPVRSENLFALHTYGNLIKGSSMVMEGLYFGGFALQLVSFIKNDFLDEQYIRFYLGYAGWSENQLEEELDDNLWVIGNFDEKLLFHHDDGNCWKMAVESLGEKYASWLNIVEEPFFN
jgi:putative transcriptional regulator